MLNININFKGNSIISYKFYLQIPSMKQSQGGLDYTRC